MALWRQKKKIHRPKGKALKHRWKGKDSTAKTRDPISREVATILYCGFALVLFVIFLMFSPTETQAGAGFYVFTFPKLCHAFGKGRFVLIFFLFYLAFWSGTAKRRFSFGRCLVASTVLFLALTTFSILIRHSLLFGDFMSLAASGNIGGIVGGIISYGMLFGFGETVSVIILLLVILVSFRCYRAVFVCFDRESAMLRERWFLRKSKNTAIRKPGWNSKTCRLKAISPMDGKKKFSIIALIKHFQNAFAKKLPILRNRDYSAVWHNYLPEKPSRKSRTAVAKNTEDADKLLDVDFGRKFIWICYRPRCREFFHTHLSGEPPANKGRCTGKT